MRSRRTLKDSLQERRRNLFNWNSTGILGPRPALVLNFIEGFALDPRITFARADATTCATRVNASGLIETVAANVPRFDYDPTTLACKGLLIEESRANVLTYSSTISNAVWGKVGVSSTTDGTLSPDGVTQADKLVEDTATSEHRLRVTTIAKTSNQVFTYSVYVKPSGRYFTIGMENAGTGLFSVFDVIGNAFIDNAPGAGWTRSGTTTITNVGGGWYRASICATTDTNLTMNVRVHLAATYAGVSSPSYLGNGTSGIYLWGAQLEAGAFATSYIVTGASAATRNYDIASMTGTNLTSWFNQSPGTIVGDANISVAGVDKRLLSLRNVGATNTVALRRNPSNAPVLVFRNSANEDLGNSSFLTGRYKIGGSWEAGATSMAFNGNLATRANTGVPTTVDTLVIGFDGGAAGFLNDTIRSIKYYNTKLTNAQLTALTV